MVQTNAKDFELRRIQNLKSGASLGLTIPKNFARQMSIKAKDFLKIRLADAQLIIEKI
jgi:antitoxin component of MazEF toxin-antitoxin module